MNSVFRILALLVVLSVIAGCARPSPVTQANLDRVRDGMTAAEVKTILGEPTDSTSEPIPLVGGTKTTYVYRTEEARVAIVLKNDTVQSKEGHFTEVNAATP